MTPLQQSIIAGIAVIILWVILGAAAYFTAGRAERDAARRIARSRKRSREIIEKGWKQ